MSFGTRLKEQRERAGLTQVQLARALGVSKGAIGNYEVDISSPKAEILYKVFDILNCDANYLFQDEMKKMQSDGISPSEMNHIKKYRLLDIYSKRLVDDVMNAVYDRMTKNINPTETGVSYIRCYELPASAGTGEPLGDTYYTDTIQVPLERMPINAHVCIRVHGDSMEPAYHDGDIVMVERFDGSSVREGEIGIFVLNGEGYIKRLGHQELVSLNPEYDPIPIHEYDDFRCLGRVLAKV